jgi:hypothetical protein
MVRSQLSLFGARARPTRPLLQHRRAGGLMRRLEHCLLRFPELDDHAVTVGITRSADGIAVLEDMIVRFDLRRRLPSHYTVAHELTHLLQGLGLVPHGEVQCDIWTLARDPLFLDEEPCYLPLPARLRRDWGRASEEVAALCSRAIDKRSHHRTYIRWLRSELEALASRGTQSSQ